MIITGDQSVFIVSKWLTCQTVCVIVTTNCCPCCVRDGPGSPNGVLTSFVQIFEFNCGVFRCYWLVPEGDRKYMTAISSHVLINLP